VTVRRRRLEIERRRQEADLAVGTARLLLGGSSLAEGLPAAAEHMAERAGLPGLRIELAPSEDGIPLDLGDHGPGSLVVPPEADRDWLQVRVVPALEALLQAALDRDALQAEVVETAALRRGDVLKTALLRAVSHDLRTPLTAIIAAGDAVRSPTLADAERDELGALVVEEATRLSRLVEKLLDLSKLQAGAAAPRRDWCSIEDVVRTAVEHVAERGGTERVELSLAPDLPLVQADAAQLERVFVNLLENAERYSGGHPVKVRARVVGGRMAVRVIDRGPGMTPAHAKHVFEPFYRQADGDGHPGSGLGLAIVKGFVEANGGRVWAESVPGQGTVFAIDLPIAPDGPGAPAPVPAAAGAPG
jgi:two-component system, OmpR family, sensor histidine kinase KdpD